MITSTVAPLWPPLRASRSFDSLCFLPSARDSPAASRVISAKSASRAPQVVVVFRTLSCDGRLVSGAADISWAPKLPRRAKLLNCPEEDVARIPWVQCCEYQIGLLGGLWYRWSPRAWY